MTSLKFFRSMDLSSLSFIGLFLFLFLINFHSFNPMYVPSYDTSLVFEIFYFFYNNLFYTWEIPQWMPYYAQGIPGNYFQLATLTPFSYFVMLAGLVFKVTNVLLLFKIAVFLEQAAFLTGMYILGRRLFKSTATVLIVCIGAVANIYWGKEISMDFRMYYLLPWVINAMILFFRKRDPSFIWIAGVIFLAWSMGSAPYYSFLCLWLLFVLFTALLLIYKIPISLIFKKSLKNYFLLGLCILLALSLFYYLYDLLSFIGPTQRGHGGRNSLGIFLTYGGQFETFKSLFQWLIGGAVMEYYIGIIPAFFFVWSLIRVRDKEFFAFLSAGGYILCISFSGIFAAFAYFFPGMAYYRHTGYVCGLLKVFLLICAGFGLENFWSSSPKHKLFFIFLIVLIFVFLSDGFGISWSFLSELSLAHQSAMQWVSHFVFQSVYFRLGVTASALALAGAVAWFAMLKPQYGKWTVFALKIILTLAVLLDVGSFCSSLLPKFVPVSKFDPAVFAVHKPIFQMQRTVVPQEKHAQDVMEALGHTFKYATVYGVAQFDPCEPKYRVDLQSQAYQKLLEVDGGKTLRRLSCDRPKLHLAQSLERPKVSYFDADNLFFDVQAPLTGDWLIYTDNFHPGWKAKVNGKQVPLHEAGGMYKAVFVKGEAKVHLFFDNGLAGVLSYVFMGFGVIFAGFVLRVFLSHLCGRRIFYE